MTNDSSPVFYDVDPARLDDICFEGPGYIQLSTTTMKLSQDTYTAIEDSSHTHSYRPDVEVYFNPDPQNTVYEVWIPVKKKQV